MFYIVTEYQGNNTEKTATPFKFEDKETAFEKFYQIAAFIPKSALDTHTVIITNSEGGMLTQPISKTTMH